MQKSLLFSFTNLILLGALFTLSKFLESNPFMLDTLQDKSALGSFLAGRFPEYASTLILDNGVSQYLLIGTNQEFGLGKWISLTIGLFILFVMLGQIFNLIAQQIKERILRFIVYLGSIVCITIIGLVFQHIFLELPISFLLEEFFISLIIGIVISINGALYFKPKKKYRF